MTATTKAAIVRHAESAWTRARADKIADLEWKIDVFDRVIAESLREPARPVSAERRERQAIARAALIGDREAMVAELERTLAQSSPGSFKIERTDDPEAPEGYWISGRSVLHSPAKRLNELRGQYLDTGNPLFAFVALGHALDTSHPIPWWVVDYFQRATAELEKLAVEGTKLGRVENPVTAALGLKAEHFREFGQGVAATAAVMAVAAEKATRKKSRGAVGAVAQRAGLPQRTLERHLAHASRLTKRQ